MIDYHKFVSFPKNNLPNKNCLHSLSFLQIVWSNEVRYSRVGLKVKELTRLRSPKLLKDLPVDLANHSRVDKYNSLL